MMEICITLQLRGVTAGRLGCANAECELQTMHLERLVAGGRQMVAGPSWQIVVSFLSHYSHVFLCTFAKTNWFRNATLSISVYFV